MNKLPMADSVPYPHNVGKIKKSSYRYKYVVNDYISTWDTEWFYHFPFPFLAVEWFDLSLDSKVVDASWLVSLMSEIGFEFKLEVRADSYIFQKYLSKSRKWKSTYL